MVLENKREVKKKRKEKKERKRENSIYNEYYASEVKIKIINIMHI